MSSSTKKRQTMAKMTRERELREKRVRKQEKKDEKKLAAAAALNAEVTGIPLETDMDAVADDESASV